MSHLNPIFEKAPVLVPKRSGKDISHENLFTAQCGTLVPCLTEEVFPGDRIQLDVLASVKLPPMATDFFGRIDAHIEAFFVPNRLLYGGWRNFIATTGGNSFGNALTMDHTYTEPISDELPYFQIGYDEGDVSKFLGRGSLADYLGYKVSDTQAAEESSAYLHNMLPFLAYHRIYQDWYADRTKEKPAFVNPDGSTISASDRTHVKYWPYMRFTQATKLDADTSYPENYTLNDGISVFDLRQRNFARDYFTTAQMTPQAGDPVKVSSFAFGDIVNPDGSKIADDMFFYDSSSSFIDDNGRWSKVAGNDDMDEVDSKIGVTSSFSIQQLRVANTLQQFLERSQAAGWKYRDQIYSRFGVKPDELCDTAVYLGRVIGNVYNRSVSVNTPNSATDQPNPFIDKTGAQAAECSGVVKGRLINNLQVKEHGFIMCLYSLVPHAYYSTGTRRYLRRRFALDFPDPLFQGLGPQEVFASELTGADGTAIFGYQPRFSEVNYHDDEVHGLLCDDQSLQAFALQRSFDNTSGTEPTAVAGFSKIPKDYLNQVSSVGVSQSGYGCWVDLYNGLKMERPFPDFVIPTLGTPEWLKMQLVDKNGKRL